MPEETLQAGEHDPDEIRVGASLSIQVGQSCLRRLTWEVSHEPAATLRRLLERAPSGFACERRAFGLSELTDGSGHSILIVEKSLRTQIRVHYLTPPERRGAVAAEIAARILATLGG